MQFLRSLILKHPWLVGILLMAVGLGMTLYFALGPRIGFPTREEYMGPVLILVGMIVAMDPATLVLPSQRVVVDRRRIRRLRVLVIVLSGAVVLYLGMVVVVDLVRTIQELEN